MKNNLTTYRHGDLLDPFFDFFAPDFIDENENYSSLEMRTDVSTEGDNYLMEIELPGINKEDVDVKLKDGYLTIKASLKKEHNEKKGYIHRERFAGVSQRTFYVGDVDPKTVEASFKDGILTLSFPKRKPEEESGSQIAIK